MKDIILIGGTAGAGKSTLARDMAKRLVLPWLSTDQIRRVIQTQTNDEAQVSAAVWKATRELILGIEPWDGGIIEGEEITPERIGRDLKDVRGVKVLFLIQNEENIAQVVADRSILPYIQTKTPEQQAEKIRELMMKNSALQAEVKNFGFTGIAAHTEDTLSRSLAALNLT